MKRTCLALTLTFLIGACAPSDRSSAAADAADAPGMTGTPGVVDVIARGLTLEAPDEIPSGWTTLRLKNESGMVHFAVLERVPDGIGVREQQEQVAPVFQEGMDLLADGEVDAALQKFGELPAWFGEIVFMGGPGLTSAGRTSEATVFLEPGTYVLECYVKTDGVFHSFNPDPTVYGMVHEFTVTEQPSGAEEPVATIRIALSAERGIEVDGDLSAGEHVVAVEFVDQTVHENFVGHDIHVVRVADGVDLDELAGWMDWTRPTGLQTPAPAEFLGGLNEMPAGSTGYFALTLEPGDYAFVAEVPRPDEKSMLTPFTVSAGGG